MTVVVGVTCGDSVAIATNLETSFGDARFGPPNFVGKDIVQVKSSIICTAGWGIYGDLLARVGAEPDCPDPVDEQSIFDFLLWFWKQLKERYHFVNDQSDGNETRDPFASLESAFVVASPSGLFRITEHISVTRFHQFTATGSGEWLALGALDVLYDPKRDPAQIALRAAQAAAKYDAHSRGPIEVWTLGGERRVVD
ncbi:MAG: hypothetical protein KDA20_01065 [Phycisphaerales bacterium]|nr:hypothetical protein [Phycisphaerales bacterium]